MTGREMQNNFLFELQEQNPDYYIKSKPNSNKIFYYISRYQMDYVNRLYEDGIDRNEPNKKRLGGLFVQTSITGGSISSNANYDNGYDVTIPTDLLYPLNQRGDLSTGETDVEVKPITYDFYNVNKENPYRKPTIAKMWRIDNNTSYTIITSGGTLTTYYVDYVKMPTDIDLSNDCELHESTHWNIVKGAVKLMLGSKKDQVGYSILDKEEKENN